MLFNKTLDGRKCFDKEACHLNASEIPGDQDKGANAGLNERDALRRAVTYPLVAG